jgi:hypothetical protein
MSLKDEHWITDRQFDLRLDGTKCIIVHRGVAWARTREHPTVECLPWQDFAVVLDREYARLVLDALRADEERRADERVDLDGV